MWDMNSGKSRGYGFLAFREKTDAEQAIATMNGEWLGSRAIRVNWANQKTQGAPGAPPGMGSGMSSGSGMAASAMRYGEAPPAPMNWAGGPQSYETVVTQTPAYNSTVYVGNLVPYCTQADLIPLFQSIGYLSEIRMQSDRGFAFVKLDTHEHAAMAIVQLQGQMVHGRPIKCSWGKDRADGGVVQPGGPASPNPALGNGAYSTAQMYGMPQANTYNQYGFGYGGFGQADATGNTAAMTPTGAGAQAAATAQPAAAGQQGQTAQWGILMHSTTKAIGVVTTVSKVMLSRVQLVNLVRVVEE